MLSIIIPVLNGETALAKLLPQLQADGLAMEIVVVDGGSDDGSRRVAEQAGAKTIAGPRGRARQMIAGTAVAEGEWLLFLHADTALAENWPEAVQFFMANCGGYAGYFDFAFDGQSWRHRIWRAGVALRCLLFKLPYGDQGLLIRRSLYDEIGGFQPLPFLEDVDIARRLGRRRLARIGITARTSPARFERDGYFRRAVKNLLIVFLFHCGVGPARLAKLYH